MWLLVIYWFYFDYGTVISQRSFILAQFWFDTMWYHTIKYQLMRYVRVWYDMMQSSTIQYDVVRQGTIYNTICTILYITIIYNKNKQPGVI